MKILIYGLNFAPELTGTGKYTAELAQMLVDAGYRVRAVCAPPYYPEWQVASGYSGRRYAHEVIDGARVWRAPLWVPPKPGGAKRLVHLASFALSSLPLLVRQAFWRPDVVLLVAPTLFCAPATLALARVTGASAWLHIQDYEVDAAFDLGLLKGQWAARFARFVERMMLKRFDVVSSISLRMVERAHSKGVSSDATLCVPNWVDTDTIYPLARASSYRAKLGIPAHHTVVLYSGNMGAKQGIETLADAARVLASRNDISFVFCGNGAAKEALAARCAALRNCWLLPLQPATALNDLLNVADIHVLPQRADAADLVMPSKLTGMLASGRAVIAMTRPGTSLHEVIEDTGVAIAPDDVDALVQAITDLADSRERRETLGRNARRYAQRWLAPAAIFERIDQRLAALARRGRHDAWLASRESAREAARAAGLKGVAAEAAWSQDGHDGKRRKANVYDD